MSDNIKTDYWISPVTDDQDKMQKLQVHKKSDDKIIGNILIYDNNSNYIIKVDREDLKEPVLMSVVRSSEQIGIELKIIVDKLKMA